MALPSNTRPSLLSQTLFRFLFLLLLLLAKDVTAGPSNRTIDDQNGDELTGVKPIFTAGWHTGQNCTTCRATLDASRTFENTWLDTTVDADGAENITLSFTGTAIYVYAILPNMNHLAGTETHTNVSFLVDGVLEQMFIRPPNPSYDYIYNSSVFAHDGLANTTHALVISPNGGTKPSVFLFDYAVYTSEDADTPPSSSTSPPPASTSGSNSSQSPNTHSSGSHVLAVIGAVVGVLAAVALGLLVFLCRRRRQDAAFVSMKDMESRFMKGSRRSSSTEPFISQPLALPAYSTSQPQPSLATPIPSIAITALPLMSEKARLRYERQYQRMAEPALGEAPSEGSSSARPSVSPPTEGSGPSLPHDDVLHSRVHALEAELTYLRGAVVVQQHAPPAYEGDEVTEKVFNNGA